MVGAIIGGHGRAIGAMGLAALGGGGEERSRGAGQGYAVRAERTLEHLPQVGEDAARTVQSKSIVEGDVGSGEFVELDADAGTPAGVDGFEAVGYRLGKRCSIDKDYAAKEAVGSDAETVCGFQVEHIPAAEPSLDIAAA